MSAAEPGSPGRGNQRHESWHLVCLARVGYRSLYFVGDFDGTGGVGEGAVKTFTTDSRIWAERANTPRLSRRGDTVYMPAVETRFVESRIPYKPQTPAGCRVDPPVSVPMVKSSQG